MSSDIFRILFTHSSTSLELPIFTVLCMALHAGIEWIIFNCCWLKESPLYLHGSTMNVYTTLCNGFFHQEVFHYTSLNLNFFLGTWCLRSQGDIMKCRWSCHMVRTQMSANLGCFEINFVYCMSLLARWMMYVQVSIIVVVSALSWLLPFLCPLTLLFFP